MIYIESKRKSENNLKKLYPNAHIVDVTSKAPTALVKLSPFYPHGNIPIPFSQGTTAMCVEGIWQGLKVFENEDIDTKSFANDKMKNIKRTVRKFGKPKGHRKGIDGTELLDYIQARIEIYLPAYLWVLENKVQHIIDRMKEVNQEKDIVLLDYSTNENVLSPKQPLSHAFLVKAFIQGKYPTKESLEKQKFEEPKSMFDVQLLKNIFTSKTDKEVSKSSKIGVSTVRKIRFGLRESDKVEVSKIKGVGKATLQKLSLYLVNNDKSDSQSTLF